MGHGGKARHGARQAKIERKEGEGRT